MPRRYHKSYGDWISTMSFFGVSIYACLKGLEFLDQGNFIRAFSVSYTHLTLPTNIEV